MNYGISSYDPITALEKIHFFKIASFFDIEEELDLKMDIKISLGTYLLNASRHLSIIDRSPFPGKRGGWTLHLHLSWDSTGVYERFSKRFTQIRFK